jgi:hypothetical protein
MKNEADARAVRVDGEVIVLHCWACGQAHYVNIEHCDREELPHMVCSESNCRMSFLLLNELIFDRDLEPWGRRTGRGMALAGFSTFLRSHNGK